MSRTKIEFSIIDESRGKSENERIDSAFAAISRLKTDLQYLLSQLDKRIGALEER